MGTPEFAIPTLQGLCAHYPVVGVVTQPDRPAGRGRQLASPPVKVTAQAEGIPVFQPERLKRLEAVEYIRAWAPDLIVVAAFGQLVPPAILELPRWGCLNIHASLLPRWRGAAPIQAAILAGDAVTGVTIMQMDAGLDTGPLLAQRPVPIGAEETAGELENRLAQLGANLLLEILPDYLAGQLQPHPQPTTGITYAPRLSKTAPAIPWERSATELDRHVRAFAPQPGAYTCWKGVMLKVLAAQALPAGPSLPSAPPGTTFIWQGLPAVHAGAGALVLLQVQMAGKRPMNGEVFLRGQRAWAGAVLSSQVPGEV